ncbi:MAG: hypothetical protein WA208_20875 [Thermoanaerobaculia bacterium]
MNRLVLLLMLVVAVILPEAAAGADAPVGVPHPNTALGFTPGAVYDFKGFDSVNLFNGNLVLTVPLGRPYTVNGNMTYSLALAYNGKPWDFGTQPAEWQCQGTRPENAPDSGVGAFPSRVSNAGMGWTLTLGRVLAKDHYANDTETPLYLGSDGSISPMVGDLTTGALGTEFKAAYYNASGDKRLLETHAGTFYLDLPNGQRHTFNSKGWLIAMQDAFGNAVSVDNDLIDDEVVRTTLTELGAAGRHVEITYKRSPYVIALAPNYTYVVDQVSLGAFGGGRATYTFEYNFDQQDVARPVALPTGATTSHPHCTPAIEVPLLVKLILPDGSTYDIDYYYERENAAEGSVRSVVLPTRGKYEWTYTSYDLPRTSCGLGWMTHTAGVSTKVAFAANGVQVGRWTYLPTVYDPTPGDGIAFVEGSDTCTEVKLSGPVELQRRGYDEVLRTVTVELPDSSGALVPVSKAVSHFSTWADAPQEGVSNSEFDYGLPFTRRVTDATGTSHLSSEQYDCSSGACTETVLRRRYSRYDPIRAWSSPIGYLRLPTLERTEFLDQNGAAEAWTQTEYEDWNGYGQFRRTELVSSFGGTRRTIVDFLTKRNLDGSYQYADANGVRSYSDAGGNITTGSLRWFGVEDPWLPGVYNVSETREGAGVSRQEACFGTSLGDAPGFLKRRRLYADTQAGPADVVVEYTPSLDGHGNVAREAYYGGDGASLDTVPLCQVALPANARYAIDHAYEFGTRKKSTYTGVSSNAFEGTVDRWTGLLSTTRDTAGVVTAYVYDVLGRITEVAPSERPKTIYEYRAATASLGANVQAKTYPAVGSTLLRSASYEYDGFGRLREETQLMPDGQTSRRETITDALGRVSKVTEFGGSGSLPATVFTYDTFDRVKTQTAPDGSVTTFDYTDMRRRGRTTANASGIVSATGSETYDALGRVVSVEEPAGAAGEPVVTFYRYDTDGRVTEVCQDSANGETCGQRRTFTYDNRGFLTKEEHPENGWTSYKYDARGHAIERTNDETSVSYDYDAAERLTKIREDQKDLVEYVYEDTDDPARPGNKRKGKLSQEIRRNYLNTARVDTTLSNDYSGPGGTLSSRTLHVQKVGESGPTTIQKVSYTTEFDEFALPKVVTMPQCVDPTIACAPISGAGTVTFGRQAGYLTTVAGFASLGYEANGMVKKVEHIGSTRLTDVYESDEGSPRPGKVSFCYTPRILQQPADTPVRDGGPVTLSVGAFEPDAVTYQWYKGVAPEGTALGGQTNRTLTVPAVEGERFWVRVTNACGAWVESATATVTLGGCVPVLIEQPPIDQVVTSGTQATLSVGAQGTDVRFVWEEFLDGLGKPCGTLDGTGGCSWASVSGASAFLTGAVDGTPRFYRVHVSGLCGEAITAGPVKVSSISGCVPPTINSHPVGTASIEAWQEHELSVVAAPQSATYKWFIGNYDASSLLPVGGNLSTLMARANESATFFVEVSIGTGDCRVKSNLAKIIVTSCPNVTVQQQPGDQRVVEGTRARLTFPAVGVAPMSFRWYEGLQGDRSTPLGVTQSNQFDTPPVTKPTVFWAEARSGSGPGETTYCAVASRTINVGVCSPPVIAAPRVLVAGEWTNVVTPGQSARLDLVISGDELAYQWYEGESGDTTKRLEGETSPFLIVSPGEDKSYWVHVVGECGEAVSATIRVKFCIPPVITTGLPPEREVKEGVPASLTVAATPAGVTYRWSYRAVGESRWGDFDTVGPTLELSSMLPGSYEVRATVSNETCSTTTGVCRVDVCRPPAISAVSTDYSSARAGDVVTLRVSASDGARIRWYQGEKSAPMLIGEGTASTLDVRPTTTTRYWARADFGDECDSETPLLTVHVCQPAVTVLTPTANVARGQSVELRVAAIGTAPLEYTWYEQRTEGPAPASGTSDGPKYVATPQATTTYFATVASLSCSVPSTPVASETMTVVVCQPAENVTVPTASPAAITQGQTAMLSVAATGTGLQFEWFEGSIGDISRPVRTGASIPVTPPMNQAYWCRISADCGPSVSSTAVMVDVCNPPIVGTPTRSLEQVPSGGTIRFEVPVSGEALTYQWYRGQTGDTSVPVTSSNASLSPWQFETTVTSTASYWLRVASKGRCSTNSAAVTAELCPAPSVSIRQTPGGSTTSGRYVWLSADSDQAGSVTYRWYQGTGAASQLAGTGASIYVAPLVPTTYWVRVANTYCSTDSAPFTVDVCGPTIGVEPQDITVQYNTSGGTLSVDVFADTTPTYRWYKGQPGDMSQPVTGGTARSVPVAPAVTSTYWVHVTTACGPGAQSRAAVVTVAGCVPPVVNGHSSSPITIRYGDSVPLAVAASGALLRYQWYEYIPGYSSGWTPVSGATSPELLVTPTYSSTSYYCSVWNDCGSAATNAIAVNVTYCTQPSLQAGPTNQQYRTGVPAEFSVTATGTDVQYQWYASDPAGSTPVAIPGATLPSLQVIPNNSGATYYARVYNWCGEITTPAASAILCNPPAFVAQSASASITEGQWAQLYALIGEGANLPVSMQWYRVLSNGAWESLAGQVYTTLTVNPVVTTTYVGVASNACGTAYTNYLLVTVNPCPKPVILSHPASQQVSYGSSATLSVGAQSDSSVTYTWYESVAGAAWQLVSQSGATIAVTPTVTSSYRVEVSNACGTVQSNVADVTVVGTACQAPSYVWESLPGAVYYWPGEPITVTIQASGTNLYYQWYKWSQGYVDAIRGATEATLTDWPEANGTVYWVRIFNQCGDMNSSYVTAYDQSVQALLLRAPRSEWLAFGGPASADPQARRDGVALGGTPTAQPLPLGRPDRAAAPSVRLPRVAGTGAAPEPWLERRRPQSMFERALSRRSE